jgi:hypothetical protein
VPKDDLCTILQPSDLRLRTELEQRRAVERAKGTAAAAAAEAGGVRTQDLVVHPVRSGLWGFALSEAGGNWGSSHAAFGYDTMHFEDLGVFRNLVYSIPEYLKRKYPSTHVQLLAELEACMKYLPRANDCRLPTPGLMVATAGRRVAYRPRNIVRQCRWVLLRRAPGTKQQLGIEHPGLKLALLCRHAAAKTRRKVLLPKESL